MFSNFYKLFNWKSSGFFDALFSEFRSYTKVLQMLSNLVLQYTFLAVSVTCHEMVLCYYKKIFKCPISQNLALIILCVRLHLFFQNLLEKKYSESVQLIKELTHAKICYLNQSLANFLKRSNSKYMRICEPYCHLYWDNKAAIGNSWINECGYVLVKFYLQKMWLAHGLKFDDHW